jgi:hypothetical protein
MPEVLHLLTVAPGMGAAAAACPCCVSLLAAGQLTRRVDEHLDVLGWVLVVEQQQLADDSISAEVLHLTTKEHDALAQQKTERIAGHLLCAGRHDRLAACLDPWTVVTLGTLAARSP